MADERTVARFLDKCQRSGDCLLWTASKSKRGHGRFQHAASSNLAHRFSYATFVGPIPPKNDIKQSCGNPSCQEPKHLITVSRGTGCSKHPDSPRSKPEPKHGFGNGRCRKCASERQADRYHNNPKVKPRQNELARIRRRVRPDIREKERDYQMRRRFGFGLEAYRAMILAQDGKCALCGESFGDKTPFVDHDHSCCDKSFGTCGKCVRGLLHNGCNGRLPHIENRKFHNMAIKYLDLHSRRLWGKPWTF